MVFILDADLSVDPEALSSLYRILQRADFLNGTRFARPMESGDIRPFNWLANKSVRPADELFVGAMLFGRLVRNQDVLSRELLNDKNSVARMDPFGDYRLLIGAGLRNLRIREATADY